jgi:hypothetical protein
MIVARLQRRAPQWWFNGRGGNRQLKIDGAADNQSVRRGDAAASDFAINQPARVRIAEKFSTLP